MQDITIYVSAASDTAEKPLTTPQSISRYQRSFNYTDYDYSGVVHTNNIDIGSIYIKVNDNIFSVYIHQYPNVCRMSILSLIDSSIYFIQSLVNPTSTVIFKTVSYAHTFKLQQIIGDVEKDGDDYQVTGEHILSIDMSKISLKNITVEKI